MEEGTSESEQTKQSCPSKSSKVAKETRRKPYYARRDATKIYLFEHFERWRMLLNELGLKIDKELAVVLLDNFCMTR
jgi:hypothetical protein